MNPIEDNNLSIIKEIKSEISKAAWGTCEADDWDERAGYIDGLHKAISIILKTNEI